MVCKCNAPTRIIKDAALADAKERHARGLRNGTGGSAGGPAHGALASAQAAHRKILEEKDREIKQLKEAQRRAKPSDGGEATATGAELPKPSAAAGKERTPQQEADAKLRSEKQADIKAWTSCLEALGDRSPEDAAMFKAKIEAARGVLADLGAKAAEARAAAAAEARDRKSPKIQLEEIEGKLTRCQRKVDDDTKHLADQQAKLAKLQEQISSTEARLERHREEVKALCVDKAKLHSELSASSAAAAGAAAPAEEEGLATLALSAVIGMLPQIKGLGLAKAEAAGASLMDSLGLLCVEVLDGQTGMAIDDKGGVEVLNPLEGMSDCLNRDALRYGKHLRDKAAGPPAPAPDGLNAAPVPSEDGQAGGTTATVPEIAPATASAPADGITLAKDSGKVKERLAGGQANRVGPF